MEHVSKIVSFFIFPFIMFIVHSTAKILGLYILFPNAGIPFHFIGGLSIAYTTSQILAFLEGEKITTTLNRVIFLVLLLSLTATVAVFWEFAEFISDLWLDTRLQPSIANTMQDQFLGILGGCTWAWIYFRNRLRVVPGS